MNQIDLSCDLGEGTTLAERIDEDRIWPVITSVNVACGGHAGDRESMEIAVERAKRHSVLLGAHPSYPDRDGFGRRHIDISKDDLESSLARQLEGLMAVAQASGLLVHHAKPHGALYNEAAEDRTLAKTMVRALLRFDSPPALVGPAASAIAETASESGIAFIPEGFADRRYTTTGRLVPRSNTNALIDDPEASAVQALLLATGGRVTTLDQRFVRIPCTTICIHGDLPGAAERASVIRKRLEKEGFIISHQGRSATA